MTVRSNEAHCEALSDGRRAVHVLGVDAQGCAGLTSEAVNLAIRAQVLVGSERLLAFFPQHTGTRLPLEGKISAVLDQVADLAQEHDVCILASGDPLFFGVAALVIARLGHEHVAVTPGVSSMQLAFARAGLPWSQATLLSVHGRPLHGVAARLRSARRAALLTDDRNTPSRLARHLLEYGESGWRAVVCEDLGRPGERVRSYPDIESLAEVLDFAPLNVLVLERADDTFLRPPSLPFLNEEAFAKKMPRAGLITKREVRALTLAQLRLRPDACMWDIGAGSGSVAIEAAHLAPDGSLFAIEVDPECAGYCRDNVRAHGADNVQVIEGRAPAALEGLPAPDAVFVGGTKGSMGETVQSAARAMTRGGRLVINAVTLENVAAARCALEELELAPEVLLVQCSRTVPLAGYLRYEALNPIHLLAATVAPSV